MRIIRANAEPPLPTEISTSRPPGHCRLRFPGDELARAGYDVFEFLAPRFDSAARRLVGVSQVGTTSSRGVDVVLIKWSSRLPAVMGRSLSRTVDDWPVTKRSDHP
jgi:hypothetical protein